MSITNNIKSGFRRLTNVNAWANLADVNQAVAQAVPYTIVGAVLNHPLGQVPSIIIMNSDGPCPAASCYCVGHSANCFTIANFATGKYMITMSVTATKGFNVLIAPLADARQNVGVEVISPTQVIVSTYDIPTAAYVNNAFKNTYLQFQIWN